MTKIDCNEGFETPLAYKWVSRNEADDICVFIFKISYFSDLISRSKPRLTNNNYRYIIISLINL